MQRFKIKFAALLLIYLASVTRSEVYEIFRRVNSEDGMEKWTDTFKIPPCLRRPTESSSTNCARFNAKTSRNTNQHGLCSCSNENASFIFYNNQWTCLRNSKVRELLGHVFPTFRFFLGENKDSPLRMLDFNDRVSIQVLGSNCEIEQGSSLYIGCNGVDIPFSSNLFTLQKSSGGVIFYFLKVNSGAPNTELLRGKIIKLAIKCSSFNGRESRRWILFKLVGNITCNSSESLAMATPPLGVGLGHLPSIKPTTQVTAKTVTTLDQTPSLISVPSVSVAVSAEATTTIFSAHSTVPSGQPEVPVSPSSTAGSRRTVIVPLPTTRGQDIQSTNSPPRSGSEESRGNNSAFSVGLIAGIGGSVVFVIIVVLCFVVFRRCHLKKPPRPSVISTATKDSVVTGIQPDSVITRNAQLNSAYEEDDQNVYRSLGFEEPPIYGSHYKALQRSPENNPDNKGEKQRDEGHAKEDHYAALNIAEDEHIYGPGNTQEPLYNVLEEDEIIYQNYGSLRVEPVNRSEEPVYNALEETYDQGVKGPISDDPHIYGNTLERLRWNGVKGRNDDPLRTRNSFVMEEPVDNDVQPDYEVLEIPDNECSEDPDHVGPIYGNTLERSYQEGAMATVKDSENINEPVYNVIDDESNTDASEDDDDFVTRDFVKKVLKELVLE